MSYVLRLYKEGDNKISGWGNSIKMGSSILEQIEDPNGETAKKEITSIPSPFARIDLVKTAFKRVAESELDGDSAHHKMVSDSLDVGQIFFEYEKYKSFFDIIVWNKNDDLEKLKNSSIKGHRQYGDTLKTYLDQDGAVYNLDRLDRMYFLNYKYGKGESCIVGATSPATLFFTSANDMSIVGDRVKFGQDKPFDGDFAPLYKRDFEYQKYLYALRKSVPNFANLFPEVDGYMVACLKMLDEDKRIKLNDITSSDYENYDTISVGAAGHSIELFDGIYVKEKMSGSIDIARQSGFTIVPSRVVTGSLPLVLPVDSYTKKTIYTTDPWDQHTKVKPYYDIPIAQRCLPDDNSQYPFITISDLLTDAIVRMPYEIDDSHYFNGNLDDKDGKDDEKKSYLLPLTDVFFQYFTVDDLKNKTVEGKNMFQMKNTPTGVTVILRIPVKAGCIEYRRTYFDGGGCNPKETNDGNLYDNKIGLGIMPLVRFPDGVRKHFRVAMFDKGKKDAFLKFYDGTRTIDNSKVVRAKKDLSGRGCSHEAYAVTDNFDRIKVELDDGTYGYVVPVFKEAADQGNTLSFTFAVDFGTTNTHIHYCKSTEPTAFKAFRIDNSERQLCKMHNMYADPDINAGFVQDFMPETISDGDDFCFPMRTVYSHHQGMNLDRNPIPLADGNIPFNYEKDHTPQWNVVKTELKWNGADDRMLSMHLETLFIMMRNKVMLNGGNLGATRIIWFYPASMTEAKVNQFKNCWINAYEKYFGENTDNIYSMSESTAPYLHFSTFGGAAPEVVTIDIGGGTTDVLAVENDMPKMLMSFRYASNAIFGDGYNSNPSRNGFVKKYKEKFNKVLLENKMYELSQALQQIEQQNKSSDIIAFLFSLTGNKVGDNQSLNFLKQLEDDDKLRYVFIIFYASIFYYIAKAMKAKGVKKPKTLAFSGNGSRTVAVIGEDDIIGRFAKLVFDKVYDDDSGFIEFRMEKNPKIATCLGGLEKTKKEPYDSISGIKTIFAGDRFEAGDDVKIEYKDISESIKAGVLQQNEQFLDFLFDLHKDNDDFLVNKLGADNSILRDVKEFCVGEEGRQILAASLDKGLKFKMENDKVTDDTKLEETLFFYPLVGLLHDLASRISDM